MNKNMLFVMLMKVIQEHLWIEVFSQVAKDIPDVLDLFKKLSKEVSQNPEMLEEAKEKLIEKANAACELSRAFAFDNLDE